MLAASCGQNPAQKKNATQPALHESATATAETVTATATKENNILPTLLRNRATATSSLNTMVEYGGKVYIWDYFSTTVPSEWISVEQPVFTIVENTVIYYSGDGFEYPVELHCSDLKGNNATVIHADVAHKVWRFGNKIVYAGKNQQTEEWDALFCYDVKTAKSTYLCAISANRVVSCDDDYVYYVTDAPDVVGRIRWDGTGEDYLEGITFPEDLYKVEGEYYYCVTSEYDYESGSGTTDVSVFSINGNKQEGKFTIEANGLITLKDGWAYYGNKTGIYKLNLLANQTLRLADIDPDVLESLDCVGFSIGVVYRDNLYFDVNYEDGEDDIFLMSRLYKMPLTGGKMEYLNKKWTSGGD